MKATIRGMQEKRARGEKGFTLIELLVVVVIIGVLVAIAIPLYLNYRKGAANKSAMSDLRGAITAAEQFYTENGNAYPGTAGTAVTSTATALTLTGGAGTSAQVSNISAGNQLVYRNNTTYYTICGWNSDGRVVYFYRSDQGGSVKKAGTASQASPTACINNNGA